MMQRIKTVLLYQLKKAEFRLHTLRNRWAIMRAYGGAGRPWNNPSFLLRVMVPGAVAVVAVLCAVMLVHPRAKTGVVKRLIKPLTAAVSQSELVSGLRSAPAQTPDTTPPADTAMLRRLWKPSPAMSQVIIANKALATLWLCSPADTGWLIIRAYSFAMGARSGPKTDDGDLKTPEGTYFIVGYKDPSEMDVIYGPLAYVLDYPSPADREVGRTGQGIWIHGSGGTAPTDWSRGCLKMRNYDLLDLNSRLRAGIGTPVVIISDTAAHDPRGRLARAALQAEREDVLREYREVQGGLGTLVMQWKKAWENKDSAAYAGFYDHQGFSGQGLGWTAWYEQKLRTFNRYPTIIIGVDNIIVTDRTDTTAVVRFIQQYQTPTATMVNGKKLSLLRSNGGWKITREYTIPSEELL